jgi:hypothetical protein
MQLVVCIYCCRNLQPLHRKRSPSGLSKSRVLFDKLSAEHFEEIQNAITEKLDKSSFSTAVYLI